MQLKKLVFSQLMMKPTMAPSEACLKPEAQT